MSKNTFTPKPTNTEGCYGTQYILRARVTKEGLCRLREGAKAGDIFPIKSLSPGAGAGYWVAHVTDLDGNVWSLSEGEWLPVGGFEK